MTSIQTDTAARLTPIQWAICVTAAIGFAFDAYVLLMLPLIVRPALMELLRVGPADPRINQWVGNLFFWPAVAGGIFGLLGGYLTDLLGRRRVLVWSILLYAVAGLAAGYSTTVTRRLRGSRTPSGVGTARSFSPTPPNAAACAGTPIWTRASATCLARLSESLWL